jgi:hypothetical protein
MTRYFFHIDGERPHRDEVGEELSTDAAAWSVAMRLARDIEDSLGPGQDWKLEVHDADTAVFLVAITTRRFR